ncbi:hypothetical protein FACS189419_04770 [Planctomycetales bacterium]|nr:hypothetical protein FACS189419_04770 [Planctomycetales bacterium]
MCKMKDLLGRTVTAGTAEQRRLFPNDLIEMSKPFAAFQLDGVLSMPSSTTPIPKGLKIDRIELINNKRVAVYCIDKVLYNNRIDIAYLFAYNHLQFNEN